MSPAAAAAGETVDTKAFSTLQAAAALKGYRVELIDGDAGEAEFVVTHDAWALTRRVATLDELRGLLQRMGVAC